MTADGNQRIWIRERRWSSPQQCYVHCLRTVLKKLNVNFYVVNFKISSNVTAVYM